MPRIVLQTITSTDGYTVLKKPPGDIRPYQGRGDIELLCGSCHQMLAEHSSLTETIVLCCPICNAFNLTAAPEPDPRLPPATGPGAARARSTPR